MDHWLNRKGKKWMMLLLFIHFSFIHAHIVAQGTLLNRRLSVDFKEITLGSALDTLAAKSNCYFTFNSHLINEEKLVSLNADHAQLKHILTTILADSTLHIQSVKKQVVISSKTHRPHNLATYEQPEKKQITGQVVDAQNQSPLRYANIGILHRLKGTVSNADGIFNLNLSEAHEDDTILVSYLGYKDQRIAIKELLGNDTIVEMKASHISLQEIIVRTRDPLALIKLAIKNTPTNYCKKNANYTTFYREWVSKANTQMMYIESLLNVYKPGYGTPQPSAESVELLRSRKFLDTQRIDTISFKLQGGVDACLKMDIMLHPNDFLNPELYSAYEYTFDNIQVYHNQSVYVVSCIPKKGLQIPLLQAQLYIDAGSLAIIQADFEYPQKTAAKLAASMVTKKSRGIQAKPTVLRYSVSYRKTKGKYYYNQSSGILRYKVKSRKQLFSSTFDIRFEMATTQIDTVQVRKIGYRERLSPRTIMSNQQIKYEPEFWGSHTFVSPEQNIQDAIKRVQRSKTVMKE